MTSRRLVILSALVIGASAAAQIGLASNASAQVSCSTPVIKGEIWFHTTNDNLDSDSSGDVRIKSSRGETILEGYFGGELNDHTTAGPYRLAAPGRASELDSIPASAFVGSWLEVHIDASPWALDGFGGGNDKWNFDFTLRFTCQDGDRVTGRYNGVGVNDVGNGGWLTLRLDRIPLTREGPWCWLGGQIKGTPAVVNPTSTTQDIYVRGIDDRLWQRWWTGSAWSDWYMHNDGAFRIGSDPAVVSIGAHHRDVFARGADGALWTKRYDALATVQRGWRPWESLGGAIQGAPAVVKPTRTTTDVYAWGLDGRLWQMWNTNGRWSGWYPHDDGSFRLASAPVVVSSGANHRDVFVRGTDGGVYHKVWNGRRWSRWYALGGQIQGAPAAVMPTNATQDIYVRGGDDRLWQIWWNGTSWSGFTMHDDGNFRLGSAPSVVSTGRDQRDVFVRGADGALYYKTWERNAWWP